MAYFMVHLNIAQEIFKRSSSIEDKGAFYLGSIAPDAISFKPGFKRSDKKYSHFCTGEEDWGGYSNYDEWRKNFIFNIKRYTGSINKDFLHGYFAHVITDIETSRNIYGPVRNKQDSKLMEAYTKDCSAAEAIFLGKMKNLKELWPLLHQGNHHCLPEFFDCRDVSAMIDFMENKLYADMPIEHKYQASVYGIADFMAFNDNTIEIIEKWHKKAR
jgi:hypothetical protein